MSKDWGAVEGWEEYFDQDEVKAQLAEIQTFVRSERLGPTDSVMPKHDEVFAALRRTPLSTVRVVVIGEDPYPNEGDAHGLAFSTKARKLPASLAYLYAEIAEDLGLERHLGEESGELTDWADQGVLLLNAALTFKAGRKKEHLKAWADFITGLIQHAASENPRIVFLLLGKPARSRFLRASAGITGHYCVVECPHPAARDGRFKGSKPFSRVNAALAAHGLEPIDWSIPERPKGPTPKG